jgi:hypothetical protein
MTQDLTPGTLAYLLCKDFRAAWDAMATVGPEGTGGNFMFARQALGLLELAARVCAEDKSGHALPDLSTALEGIESRYFTPLPGRAPKSGGPDFDLPSQRARGSASSNSSGRCSTWCATGKRISRSRSW